ncbi:MAG: GNAT family N-acetyltransferase [Planktotalea sp.]|jgi:RimJ/RimL family protein N-acetyltransferase|uniref:GNAT family N-acetyltransferase n=2 Tax=Planktotalea sp. TaxID=2029877 RepID=UPI000183955A|nr:GNAT family N-acetyltransferase [Planktotalea sp.]EDZ44541.1 acetyltransferase, gnat family [Rhodobacteraceae bacterium HTCC2083]MBT5820816.1 GNAT family N-acetyltransferase [Paracoccaceae bacterium]MDG1075911.1 GNAT family N-acetyltransferase [Planktotalea sp.]MDG1082861.1 GNAT family N-acetyltransferase [Planktotalea sp.]HCW84007.1 N-acetyltransferase [Paracoccaceae bacterium]
MTTFTVTIPTIETERLILRAPLENDIDALESFYATERSHLVGGPLDRPNCWRLISGNFGHWLMRGYGMWHLHHKADDRMIGACGFIFREGWDEPELGWNVHDGYEGKSIAFEAAFAARAYGAAHFDLDGVISYLNPSNTRSVALTKRLGATFERKGQMLGNAVDIYRHPKQGAGT